MSSGYEQPAASELAGISDRELAVRAINEGRQLADALERTDSALRAVLAGKPVRDADEILSVNNWLLFAEGLPQGAKRRIYADE